MSLNGIDIASYQSKIQPSKLTTTDFVIVKFTQGTTYLNPYAKTQYSMSKKADELLGGYHYGTGKDPVKEAQYFIASIGKRVGECILALDWQGYQNSVFGTGKDVDWCLKFMDQVYRLTGVKPFIYMSKSVARKYDWSKVAKKYPFWCAQYGSNRQTNYQSDPWTDNNGFGAWKTDTIRQYSSKGRIAGYAADIDLDKAYLTKEEWMNLAKGKVAPTAASKVTYSRDAIVKLALSYLGAKEGSKQHKYIIDTYNNYGAKHGRPRGYTVKYTDSWCATFISFLAIELGYTDIIPIECGCPQMIQLAKKKGIWVENDAYVPKKGDIILYDWQDSGKGDNTGTPDHIGIVTNISNKYITITQGNKNDAVENRGMSVNGKFIRGYICPKYDVTEIETIKEQVKEEKKAQANVDNIHTVKFKGIISTKSDPLNIRLQPSKNAKTCSFSPLKKGTEIGVCYQTGDWYLIKYNGKFGYAHSSYIKKK